MKENFQDDDLWETFREDFHDFNEDSFRLTDTQRLRKLHRLLRKPGVWVEKNKKSNNPDATIARSLANTLIEDRPTPWTEAEIIEHMDKEQFDSFRVNRMIENDYGRRPRKFDVYTPGSVLKIAIVSTSQMEANSTLICRLPPCLPRILCNRSSRHPNLQIPEHMPLEIQPLPMPQKIA